MSEMNQPATGEQEKARAEVLAERLKSCPRHPHWSGIVTDCAFCDRLAEQVAAVEAKAEQFECGGSTAYSNAAIEIRAALANPAPVLAARDAKVAARARHVVHVTAEPVAEDAVWCDECEEWVTSGAPDRAAGGDEGGA